MNAPPPRILCQGDISVASRWIGYAKKVAKECYRQKIVSKLYRIGTDITIRVENVFPVLSLFSGICKVWIEAKAAGGDFLAVVWLPEGLMLTPRSTAAQYGYGFPKREAGVLNEEDGIRFFTGGAKINPPFGTKITSSDDEALNQVLINRFPNNKYLDRRDYITGLPNAETLKEASGTISLVIPFPEQNRRLRDLLETEVSAEKRQDSLPFVVYWPPFYYPTDTEGNREYWETVLVDEGVKGRWLDEPGLNTWGRNGAYQPVFDKGLKDSGEYVAVFRQFEVDEDTGLSNLFSEQLIYETETDEWFCHWPEELLYDNNGFEMVFYLTNQYRAEVGKKALIREIRGHAIAPRMVLAECQRASVSFHDNEDLFRLGYETYSKRAFNAASNLTGGGENLQIGYAQGLGIGAGEKAAHAWRNSPGHYANMVHAAWDDPPYNTSHEIMGRIYGKATEMQAGELTERVAGNFWSQVFTRRESWVAAGNIQQTTKYGTVSFFSNPSPIGWVVREVVSVLELNVCYKGRLMLIWPAYEKILAGYSVIVLGAALCLYNNVPHVRVIFYAVLESDLKFIVCRKPLHNNADDSWTEECTQAQLTLTTYQNTASFNDEGTVAFLTLINVTTDDKATWYFPKAANQFDVFASSVSHWKYTAGVFTKDVTYTGPEITYTVETAVNGSTNYFTRYKQECAEQEIEVYPFYVKEIGVNTLKPLKMLYNFLVDQTRVGYASPVYNNSYQILETLILPSGKEIVVKIAEAATNIGKTALTLEAGAYFLVFLYLDPYYEDLVYLKINLRGDGIKIYGQATLYADLGDGDGPVEVATYAEQKLSDDDLTHNNMFCEWTGTPNASTIASGLISTAISFGRDGHGKDHPLFLVMGENTWKCVGYTGTYSYYTQKPITGTHRGTLDGAIGTANSCIIVEDAANFTYPASLKVAEYPDDGIECFASRYKDKFVMQMRVNLDKNPSAWRIPFTKENTIWANFDLEELVGIGELTDILPLGAIQ